MKKQAKLLSLFIALIMVFAIALPVMAGYETSSPEFNSVANGGTWLSPGAYWDIPDDYWYLSTVYHWVVRGDTLAGIAANYGVAVDYIIRRNWNYFVDLFYRNNTNTGMSADDLLNGIPFDTIWGGTQLDHGVRLCIYDTVTAKHYVRRGDTLDGFANGELQYPPNWWLTMPAPLFVLTTTTTAIQNENAEWFWNLDLLNITRKRDWTQDHVLEESALIFARYWGFVGSTLPYDHRFGEWGFEWELDDPFALASNWIWGRWDVAGSPLYITVPVDVSYNPNWPLIEWGDWSLLREYWETNPGVLFPLDPTQIVYNNSVPAINSVPLLAQNPVVTNPFNFITTPPESPFAMWNDQVYPASIPLNPFGGPNPTITSGLIPQNWPNVNPIGNYPQGWSLNQSNVPGVGPTIGAFSVGNWQFENLFWDPVDFLMFGHHRPWRLYEYRNP